MSRWRYPAAVAATVLIGAMPAAAAGAAHGPTPHETTLGAPTAHGATFHETTLGGPTAPRARAARSLKASDTAHLRYISASGSLLNEEGHATGTLPGGMRVRFDVGSTFSGSFTIYAKGGSITGHGRATPSGEGAIESFAGKLSVTGGTGAYRHAKGTAGLYGTFNRNTYALVVQTTGTLSY